MSPKGLEVWCRLTHVRQRWRCVVLSSPVRLNLRLVCTGIAYPGEVLYCWPTLPIIIEEGWLDYTHWQPSSLKVKNAITALTGKHRDRDCQISFRDLGISQLDSFTGLMQDPFPMLTHLELSSRDESATVISDSLLGGSSPLLRSLCFSSISFPALPNLLLSTNNLVHLRLRKIYHSGYISPELMVTYLSSLTGLKTLDLSFLSPRSRPNLSARHPSSFTRVDLPALTEFFFHGVSEYIEDLVARINAPLLSHVWIAFFNQLLFDLSHISQFIGRIENFKALRQSQVYFNDGLASVKLSSFEKTVDSTRTLMFYIKCTPLEWQPSSLVQVCCPFLSPLQRPLESLHIGHFYTQPQVWRDDLESIQWLELLRPFITVKNLYLFGELSPPIACALQELTRERATEVLTALQGIHIQLYHELGPVRRILTPFIAARQLSGYPVSVNHSKRILKVDGWYWSERPPSSGQLNFTPQKELAASLSGHPQPMDAGLG